MRRVSSPLADTRIRDTVISTDNEGDVDIGMTLSFKSASPASEFTTEHVVDTVMNTESHDIVLTTPCVSDKNFRYLWIAWCFI